MIIPTVLYGFLPTYETIGIAATVFVFIFRITQGISVGGEMSTALVYIIEEAPPNMKATLTGYLFATTFGGYAALIVYSLYRVSTETENIQTADWTWRIAFVSSLIIGVFGVLMRRLMPTSYEFDNIEHNHAILKNPITKVFQNFYVEFVILFFGYLCPPVLFYSNSVWLPAYLESNLKNVPDSYAYDTQLITGAIWIVFTAVSGHICDKYFGFYKNVKFFLTATIIDVLVCYSVMSVSKNIYVISFFQILLSFSAFGCQACLYWCAAYIPDARIRNTLTGITYNLGMAIFVSTLFDMETYLSDRSIEYGGFYAGFYVAILSLMSLIAIVYAHNYHTWKNYHYYGAVNPHNIEENDSVDITDDDEEIDLQNPYAAI